MDNGVIMDLNKKEVIFEIITKLNIIYDIITEKDNKKDYKYKTDEWEEILKGNDYY